MLRTILLVLAAVCSTMPMATTADEGARVRVTNPISVLRASETIALATDLLKQAFPGTENPSIQVRDAGGNALVTQAVDMDGDGVVDEILFQADFKPSESREFTLSLAAGAKACSTLAYAAYVPGKKGLEDLSWENDLVGYRFYGQARSEEQGTGTGVDVWCKRVPYPMTHKWYDPGINYHRDTGYGADHYSAGKNQGCGGTGIYATGTVRFSKPFSSWKVVANGPIRTIFELEFVGWQIDAGDVVETKRVTLDAGHYLNRFESTYSLRTDAPAQGSEGAIPLYHAVGLVQRESSETRTEQDRGWLCGWESLGRNKGELGTSVVASPSVVNDVKEIDNHLYAILSSEVGRPVEYYAGAAWSEFGAVKSFRDWQEYVARQAECIANPCILLLVGGAGGN